jgi:outer membrane receptor for monomeric catechols
VAGRRRRRPRLGRERDQSRRAVTRVRLGHAHAADRLAASSSVRTTARLRDSRRGWAEEPLAPTTIQAAAPVAQTNFYGSLDYDYDQRAQDNGTVRAEHDVEPHVELRFQSRYNRTTREASSRRFRTRRPSIATTNLVTIWRQGNERRNEVTSHQFSLIDRFSTGGCATRSAPART